MNSIITSLNQRKFIMAFSIVATLCVSLFMVAPAHGTATDTFGIGQFGARSDLGSTDVRETIARIINVALSLLGVVAVVIILAGGFKWMTAGGNEDKVGEARKLIFAGVIGMAIVLSAFAIARFVLGQLSVATGTGRVEGFTP